jgi:hypothetical protein
MAEVLLIVAIMPRLVGVPLGVKVMFPQELLLSLSRFSEVGETTKVTVAPNAIDMSSTKTDRLTADLIQL